MSLTLSAEGSSLKLLTLKKRGGTMYGNLLPVLVQFKISGGSIKDDSYCLPFPISLEVYSSFSECLLSGIMPSCLKLFLSLQTETQIFVL